MRWAMAHPIAAIKAKHHLKEIIIIYKEVKLSKILDTINSGGKLDAFRHTFAMAYLVRFIGERKLKTLGIAHEKDNKLIFYKGKSEDGERADSLSCEMDLRNNELGYSIGVQYKTQNINDLKQIVLNQILMGNAWHLKKNNQSQYLSCNDEIIDIKNYKDKWAIPKCLIKTN